MNKFSEAYSHIRQHIDPKNFQLPNNQSNVDYFPEYLDRLLSSYTEFYESKLIDKVDSVVPFENGGKNVVINKIKILSNSIRRTVELFYEGKVLEASSTLFKTLDDLLLDDIGLTTKVEPKNIFYRARIGNNTHFEKKDLFHIDFSLRHIVSTNRYSIPGFPALYLGDTTYVCWEEFNQYKLRDLWFVKVENQTQLNLLQIQRIEDFLVELDHINELFQLTFLLRYLLTFPLSLACTIKVKYPNGSFKPEYIIPQMLSEYVSQRDKIDGIKFPSTKVNYERLYEVKAYNYVFPVKSNFKSGFCKSLKTNFHLTEPTSLDLEEILHNPTTHPMFLGGGSASDLRAIELIKGVKHFYSNTSFGKIEKSFVRKNIGPV